MGWPAAESAQRGLTRRCAILGNLCDMVAGKEAQRVLGALAVHSCKHTHEYSITRTITHTHSVDAVNFKGRSISNEMSNVISFESINQL